MKNRKEIIKKAIEKGFKVEAYRDYAYRRVTHDSDKDVLLVENNWLSQTPLKEDEEIRIFRSISLEEFSDKHL